MKLFIYEHCPFCTRVRIIASKLAVTNIYLAYDDIVGHTKYIFKKQVPFLQKEDGTFMVESMDICKYLNTSVTPNILAQETALSYYTQEITKLTQKAYIIAQPMLWQLMRDHPLNIKNFPTQEAKDYYTNINSKNSHSEWHNITQHYLQKTIDDLEEYMALNKENYFNQILHTLSWHDVEIFPWLRNLTILEGQILSLGNYTREYLNRVSMITQIPLYV